MREFVAEQYMSSADPGAARRGASAARQAAEELTRGGTPVEFVRSIFVPRDETCLYVYRADSIETVRAALARTPLRFERVSEAVTTTATASGGTRESNASDGVVGVRVGA